ncbi:inhibitor of apoptosis 4 [Adoxophyes honmai entomopoxvirus 'L']|uniref:Inhibitor of apoptosis 4 n=1 Tax=Adoxophyes honmai entomopoxvirus 'L' TaxID=1293540 RepID=A0A916KP31_9POXV|nr:inhibitor of apoptosis 4 [Adoxophyes honmai entomopoxvirus 'L']CCU55446.1 inhibitor of apoptosis 4 [Adoxophyes honmai entomopoxvirus 'L']
MDNEFVELICINYKNKLKISINDTRYNRNILSINILTFLLKYFLFCNFPRNLRKLNKIYRVKLEDIKLITGKTRDYYYISRNNIELLNNIKFEDIKIYSDKDMDNCIICLDNEKFYIYIPCGHFYVCKFCQKNIKTCPICRSNIVNCISKNELKF